MCDFAHFFIILTVNPFIFTQRLFTNNTTLTTAGISVVLSWGRLCVLWGTHSATPHSVPWSVATRTGTATFALMTSWSVWWNSPQWLVSAGGGGKKSSKVASSWLDGLKSDNRESLSVFCFALQTRSKANKQETRQLSTWTKWESFFPWQPNVKICAKMCLTQNALFSVLFSVAVCSAYNVQLKLLTKRYNRHGFPELWQDKSSVVLNWNPQTTMRKTSENWSLSKIQFRV